MQLIEVKHQWNFWTEFHCSLHYLSPSWMYTYAFSEHLYLGEAYRRCCSAPSLSSQTSCCDVHQPDFLTSKYQKGHRATEVYCAHLWGRQGVSKIKMPQEDSFIDWDELVYKYPFSLHPQVEEFWSILKHSEAVLPLSSVSTVGWRYQSKCSWESWTLRFSYILWLEEGSLFLAGK